ncbi:DNA polymerase sliding clamp A [Acidilobus saccharovorans 345-15]|uniref:DNA polymerase sliding clamp n=1 Tax=Acidilobus saccharovorans (strain DSM 16705 / JCM 18335 / VKM B-2471 / 345-15) TaxID=666510 RepID=D9Q1J9_ACIS3|nr:DNA polymerase sliding clamp A [Acidilobus saccharovorans]ADL19187.1 DNA polymerase sliding clamp A [Acidilobus saccharovorans 345-15]
MSELESQFGNAVARFRYPDAKMFRSIIDSLSDIIEEAAFTITKDGVKVSGLDPAKVAYVEVTIPYSSFLEYELSQDSVTMGANLASLSKALVDTKKGNSVEFRVSQSQVLIKVEGQARRVYLLPNIEVASEIPEMKLEHDADIKIMADPFRRAVEDAGEFGNAVEFEATDTYFAVRASGERRAEAKFLSGSGSLISLEVKESAKAVYDYSYLDKVLSLTKVAEQVEVMFKTDNPLELRLDSPSFSVRYVLAPYTGEAAGEEKTGRRSRRKEAKEEEAAESEESEEAEESEGEEEEEEGSSEEE